MENLIIANTESAITEFALTFREKVIPSFYLSELDKGMTEYILIELLNNAFEHGNKESPNKSISISWKIEKETMTLAVTDEGEGFTPIILPTPPPLGTLRGRGLWSIKSDERVRELNFNEKGNEVSIILSRKAREAVKKKSLNIFNGLISLIEPQSNSNLKEVTNFIIDSTTPNCDHNGAKTYFIIDLSVFTTVSSGFLALLGSKAQDSRVACIALCNLQPAIQNIAERMHIKDSGIRLTEIQDVTDGLEKFRIFKDTKRALLELASFNDHE